MSSGQDEVLSCDSESFDGFSTVESEHKEEELPSKEKKGKTIKSVVVKPSASKKTEKKSEKPSGKKLKKKTVTKSQVMSTKSANSKDPCVDKSNESLFDLNKLSENDICKLREVLGVQHMIESDNDSVLGPVENLPNLKVQLDSRDISDNENEPFGFYNENSNNIDMSKALFEEDDCSGEDNLWNLPRLSAPKKGKSIQQSLADMINMLCTSSCDMDSFISNYSVPENCDQACPPSVNKEVWKIMDRKSQSVDKGIVEIQNLVASGVTPIIRLADLLKKQISDNTEAKKLMSDALVMLGQVQYRLSLRRRYLIRPSLKKKYQGLCSVSMPITTMLFGDDVAKDIKSCDSMSSLGKDYSFNPYFRYQSRGRGNRYGNNNNRRSYSGNRYAPYYPRGQGRPQMGQNRFGGYRIPRKAPTATVTSPNEG